MASGEVPKELQWRQRKQRAGMPVSGSLLQMEGSVGVCSLLWGCSLPWACSGESGILLEVTQPLWDPTLSLQARVSFFAGKPPSPSLMLLGVEMDPCSQPDQTGGDHMPGGDHMARGSHPIGGLPRHLLSCSSLSCVDTAGLISNPAVNVWGFPGWRGSCPHQ